MFSLKENIFWMFTLVEQDWVLNYKGHYSVKKRVLVYFL